MSIVINTNIQSLISQNALTKNTNMLEKAMEQLTTGLRINRAKDDAAGLVISEKMNSELRADAKVQENIENALNLINIAEGSMISINEDLQRIRELCIQGANEIYTTDSKNAILDEIQARLDNINMTAKSCDFNGLNLLDGSLTSLRIQCGNGSDEELNTIDIAEIAADLRVQTTAGGLNIALPVDAEGKTVTGSTMTSNLFREYIKKLDVAVNVVTTARGDCGTFANRLQSTNDNITIEIEGLTQAKSSIVDVDIAKAASDLIQYQILQQTSSSILAQANQLPAMALSLLS